jgi:hypothetical protein
MTTEILMCSCGHNLGHHDDGHTDNTPCFSDGCLCMKFEEVVEE